MDMSLVEIISETKNDLLERRELTSLFRAGNGLLTREAAANAIASKIGVNSSDVQVISLKGKFGVRDLVGRAYVFQSKEKAKKQLPNHLFIRQLPKDERKKVMEEKKKAKTASPAPKPQQSGNA